MEMTGVLFSLGAAFLWGIAPVLYKRAIGVCSFSEVNELRALGYFIAAMFFFVLFKPSSASLSSVPVYVLAFIGLSTMMGLFIGDVMYMLAIKHIGASKAVSITATYPLFVTLTSFMFLKENVTYVIIAGTLLVVSGLVLIRRNPSGNDAQSIGDYKKGFMIATLTAILWGVSITLLKWILMENNIDIFTLNLLRSIMLFLMSTIYWLWESRGLAKGFKRLGAIPSMIWVEIVGAGMTSICIGGILFVLALHDAPASIVTPITATSPLISTLLAIFLLKERIIRTQWAGMFLVIAGTVVINI